MKEKMIFSYDFFTNGMFGLSIFFFFSLILLFILGFIFVGFITFFVIYLYKRKDKPDLIYIVMYLLLINILMIYLTFNKITDIQYDIYTYVIIFNSFLYAYIGIVYAGKGLHKFISLIILILVFIWSTLYYHHIISSFVETGLLQFRMGGGIATRIINEKNYNTITEGNLTLLTPNKIFLKEKNKISIFNRNNVIIELLDMNATN